MRALFTEDFFKNLAGFATILVVAIGIMVLASEGQTPQTPPSTTQTAASH